jgi:NTE family protein
LMETCPHGKILDVQGLSLEQRDEIREYLASNDLFRNLSDETLTSVEAELEWIRVSTDDVLMRQGEIGDCLYVLLSGRLRATIQREPGILITVGDICPGEVVGEMSLIVDERRSATVRALRPSSLVRLTRTGFDRMRSRHAEIMKHIAELVVRRLRQANVAIAPGNRGMGN